MIPFVIVLFIIVLCDQWLKPSVTIVKKVLLVDNSDYLTDLVIDITVLQWYSQYSMKHSLFIDDIWPVLLNWLTWMTDCWILILWRIVFNCGYLFWRHFYSTCVLLTDDYYLLVLWFVDIHYSCGWWYITFWPGDLLLICWRTDYDYWPSANVLWLYIGNTVAILTMIMKGQAVIVPMQYGHIMAQNDVLSAYSVLILLTVLTDSDWWRGVLFQWNWDG